MAAIRPPIGPPYRTPGPWAANSSHGLGVGDINGDGLVNGSDLSILLNAWGGTGPADLNQDGTVNGMDLAIMMNAWS